MGPSGTPAPTGVQRGPLHCGRRPLRVFSGNLCMQADVGIGPYEGNRPYPKGTCCAAWASALQGYVICLLFMLCAAGKSGIIPTEINTNEEVL